jgi:YesN/AraC family two-component response regulator
MKIKYLLLFLITGIVLFPAQTNKIGKNALEERTYEELNKEFYKSRIGDGNSKSIASSYLKKAKSEKNKAQIAEGYVMLHFEEDLPNALKYLDSLQHLTQDFKENTYPARIYLLRGNLYFRNDNLQSALNNYILGLKYAKKEGNKRQIALAHISIAYLNNYIGKHEETTKVLKHYAYEADYMNEEEKTSLKLNLADAYIEINKMDSAYALIQEGLKNSQKNRDIYRYHQNLELLGYYHLHSKNYQKAIDGLSACKKYFFTNSNDKRDQNYTLLYLGKSYAGLQEKAKAADFFRKIDSMVLKTNYIYPELRDVYTYLIDYYKENSDTEKQLYYVDRFLKVDQVLDNQFRYISRELPRRYDTPELQQEKENITNELTKRKSLFYIVLSLLLISHLLFINVYFKYKKSEKNYKKIAQDLIQSVNENTVGKNRAMEVRKETLSETFQTENTEDKTSRTISEDIAQNILKELEIFEDKDQFLNKGITLGSLAKKIKTNSKYLSEIINTYKGKNFATYLNDLRIDYAISRLANDKKFRSYKIPFIAEELGYNNEQAFTLAFKKRTGTPLSIYLKEIENMSLD